MEDKLREFFEVHVSPLNKKIQADECNFFEMGFDNNVSSYFVEPQNPLYLNLSNILLDKRDKFETYLKEFWKNDPQLESMVPALSQLAFELKKENIEQSSELSPFMYTMF